MAKFRVTSPDGQTYEITAPDDATPDQVLSYAQSQFAKSVATDQPKGRTLGENIGLGTRNVVEGLVNAASVFTDPIVSAVNLIPGVNVRSMRETVPEALTAAGLPKAENDAERMMARVQREVAGVIPTMGVGAAMRGLGGTAGAIGQALAERPVLQAAGAAGSAVGAQTAREAGAGPLGEAFAGMGGSVAGMGGVEALRASGNALGALAQPLYQRGRERIAADVLLRSSADPNNLDDRIAAGLADPMRRLPGSPVTTAQAAQDPGLMVLESGLRSDAGRTAGQGGVSGAVAFRDIEAQRNAARQAALAGMADELTPEARGEAVRGALRESQEQARQAVSRAYGKAEQAGAAVPADEFKTLAGEISSKYYGPGSGGVPGALREVMAEIGETAGPQNFEWAQNVQSRLGEIAGMAAARGERRLAAAAGEMRATLGNLMGNVTQEAAALRRQMGETFGRDASGANVVGRIMARDPFGAPTMPTAKVATEALTNPQALRQTLKAAGGKVAEVKSNLRGQFIENMLGATQTTGAVVDAAGNVSNVLSPAQFKRFFDKNAVIAKELFDEPGQYLALQRLANDFQESMVSAATAKARGSDTAQNLSVGNFIARVSNGLIDPGNPLAQTLVGVGPIMRALYSAPEAATRELLIEAARDPKFARILLAKAGPSGVERATQYLNSTMGQRLRDALNALETRVSAQSLISQQQE